MKRDFFIPISPPLRCLFNGTVKRFFFIHGGRGSGKSIGAADAVLSRALKGNIRVLCCREVQKSIKESVHEVLIDRINAHGWEGDFDDTREGIRNKTTGAEFLFSGLRDHTAESIKSFHNIDVCWLEEAHAVSEKSLKILIPTIRNAGSFFIFTYNRYLENDPVHALCRREIAGEAKRREFENKGKSYYWEQAESADAIMVYMNYDANPFFPDVLQKEMEKEFKESQNAFLHIWKGMPLAQTADSIISRVDVEAACKRTVKAEGDLVAGVDVARFGDDASVFFLRKGLKVIRHERHTKTDLQTLGAHLEVFLDHKKDTTCRVDDSGVGGGLTDYMRAKGYRNIEAITFNQTPRDPEKYDMLISEMWFTFKGIIGEVELPDIPELKEELTERKYSFDKRQRRSIEPKRDFKKRVGRSPDYGDALLLCYLQNSGVVTKDFSTSNIDYLYEGERQ